MKRFVFKGTLITWSILYVLFVTITSCNKDDAIGEQCVKLEQKGYSVTVCGGKGGTVNITSVEPSSWADFITITATAISGYRFLEWQVEWQSKDGIIVSTNNNNPASFGMFSGADDVVWKAIFVPSVGLPESITVSQYNTVYGNIYEVIHMYYYDIQNRLTGARAVSDNFIRGSFFINYNDNEYFLKYETCYTQARCYRATFSQNGNKISFATRFRFSASCIIGLGNGELELNAQGLPVKLTYEEVYIYGADVEIKRSTSTVLTLTWQNGNITIKEWESEIEFERRHWTETEIEIEKIYDNGTITYTHDDKKNPFYNCNTPKWFFWWLTYFRNYEIYGYNNNNIKTETKEDGSSITYEYRYKDNDFPVTRTWAAASMTTDAGTTTETYTYK